MTTKAQRQAKQEAIDNLREFIKPGDTIYTIVRRVSRSGMSRSISCYVIENNQPRWISYNVALATSHPFDNKWEAVKIGGCGMDMGFALVYSLSHALYPEYDCLGEFCPSSYHQGHPPPEAYHHDGYALRQRWLG